MKPWHGNFLFKGVCTLLISSLGDFGKKERGIGSLAAGWGKLRSGRPRGWTQEVGRSRRGCPHIGVSVSVVKSRDLQPPVPESRGFLLPGWREGFEGRRGLRSALLIGGGDVDGVVDGVVPLPIVLATPPISCGRWAIREELDTPWRLSPCSSPPPPTPPFPLKVCSETCSYHPKLLLFRLVTISCLFCDLFLFTFTFKASTSL